MSFYINLQKTELDLLLTLPSDLMKLYMILKTKACFKTQEVSYKSYEILAKIGSMTQNSLKAAIRRLVRLELLERVKKGVFKLKMALKDGSRMVPGWFQDGSKENPKRFQKNERNLLKNKEKNQEISQDGSRNGIEMVPKWFQNGSEMVPHYNTSTIDNKTIHTLSALSECVCDLSVLEKRFSMTAEQRSQLLSHNVTQESIDAFERDMTTDKLNSLRVPPIVFLIACLKRNGRYESKTRVESSTRVFSNEVVVEDDKEEKQRQIERYAHFQAWRTEHVDEVESILQNLPPLLKKTEVMREGALMNYFLERNQ